MLVKKNSNPLVRMAISDTRIIPYNRLVDDNQISLTIHFSQYNGEKCFLICFFDKFIS